MVLFAAQFCQVVKNDDACIFYTGFNKQLWPCRVHDDACKRNFLDRIQQTTLAMPGALSLTRSQSALLHACCVPLILFPG